MLSKLNQASFLALKKQVSRAELLWTKDWKASQRNLFKVTGLRKLPKIRDNPIDPERKQFFWTLSRTVS